MKQRYTHPNWRYLIRLACSSPRVGATRARGLRALLTETEATATCKCLGGATLRFGVALDATRYYCRGGADGRDKGQAKGMHDAPHTRIPASSDGDDPISRTSTRLVTSGRQQSGARRRLSGRGANQPPSGRVVLRDYCGKEKIAPRCHPPNPSSQQALILTVRFPQESCRLEVRGLSTAVQYLARPMQT